MKKAISLLIRVFLIIRWNFSQDKPDMYRITGINDVEIPLYDAERVEEMHKADGGLLRRGYDKNDNCIWINDISPKSIGLKQIYYIRDEKGRVVTEYGNIYKGASRYENYLIEYDYSIFTKSVNIEMTLQYIDSGKSLYEETVKKTVEMQDKSNSITVSGYLYSIENNGMTVEFADVTEKDDTGKICK